MSCRSIWQLNEKTAEAKMHNIYFSFGFKLQGLIKAWIISLKLKLKIIIISFKESAEFDIFHVISWSWQRRNERREFLNNILTTIEVMFWCFSYISSSWEVIFSWSDEVLRKHHMIFFWIDTENVSHDSTLIYSRPLASSFMTQL